MADEQPHPASRRGRILQKFLRRKSRSSTENIDSKTIGTAVGLGIIIGTIIGVLTDNVGLWIAMGVAIGAAIGSALAKKQGGGG